MLHIHKRQKRMMDADESTFRVREPADDKKMWSPSWPGVNLIDTSLWLLLKGIARFPSDADTNHKNISFRINGHKR